MVYRHRATTNTTPTPAQRIFAKDPLTPPSPVKQRYIMRLLRLRRYAQRAISNAKKGSLRSLHIMWRNLPSQATYYAELDDPWYLPLSELVAVSSRGTRGTMPTADMMTAITRFLDDTLSCFRDLLRRDRANYFNELGQSVQDLADHNDARESWSVTRTVLATYQARWPDTAHALGSRWAGPQQSHRHCT